MEYGCAALQYLLTMLGSEILRNIVMTLGLLVAVISVMNARSIARKKQTADMMFASRVDKEISQGYATVRELHDAKDANLRTLAAPEGEENIRKAEEIRYVLNHWERISVGIQEGIYDEVMFHKNNYTTVINLYERAEPLIKAIREKEMKETFYQDFEALYDRWKKKPLKALKPKFR